MVLFWLLCALLQCLLLWLLGRTGRQLESRRFSAPALEIPLPSAALIIPMAGSHAQMKQAVRSLITQDYPGLRPILVTESYTDPATRIALALQKEFPFVERVMAGTAAPTCGQKNHNLLAGIRHAGAVDLYIFCDSTHDAPPDFLRKLVRPVAAGEAAFATGYHAVEALDNGLVTLSYQWSVRLMRLMQGLSAFTQPWGGAMVIARTAFERYGIAEFWATRVVDDCSLAALLLRSRLGVALSEDAVLRTTVRAHRLDIWLAWLDRQIRFLKYCIPGQWVLLGGFALIMTVPTLLSLLAIPAVLLGICDLLPALALGLGHLALLSFLLPQTLEKSSRPVSFWRRSGSFLLGIACFSLAYLRSIGSRTLRWHGKTYTVGKQGKVVKTS